MLILTWLPRMPSVFIFGPALRNVQDLGLGVNVDIWRTERSLSQSLQQCFVFTFKHDQLNNPDVHHPRQCHGPRFGSGSEEALLLFPESGVLLVGLSEPDCCVHLLEAGFVVVMLPLRKAHVRLIDQWSE